MKNINIGLIGCGNVGTGVVKILSENKKYIEARLGAKLVLKAICDIDIKKDRGISFAKDLFTQNADEILDDPSIDIVLEMVGGTDFAKQVILKAINNNKQVVTANKCLLATSSSEIFDLAYEKNVDLAFEASVGGCMPIIKSLRESLASNRIDSIKGILNGTCNYILTKITQEKTSFETALQQAQTNGFAEADPTLDIEGFDTAHKLAILMSLAFGAKINFEDIFIEGITHITPMDIKFAKMFGYNIKLLAIGRYTKNGIEARVHPTMVPFGNLLGDVNGSLNAATVTGNAVGEVLFYGHGAGMMPTASAVVSDVIDIARNIMTASVGRIPLLSYQKENLKNIPILSIDEIYNNYYIRFSALDHPGVLSKISGFLGDHGISIKIVHQEGRNENGSVPVVILTHKAKEAEINKALNKISTKDVVPEKPILIRICNE